MSREEIEKRIEELKDREFYINMADHLSREDFDEIRDINLEISKFKQQLKEV